MKRLVLELFLALITLPSLSYAYPNGTTSYVTDASPFPEADITYTLRAPLTPGTYPITAAFLYGTENTEKAGFFQRPSGRILFSEEAIVRVE